MVHRTHRESHPEHLVVLLAPVLLLDAQVEKMAKMTQHQRGKPHLPTCRALQLLSWRSGCDLRAQALRWILVDDARITTIKPQCMLHRPHRQAILEHSEVLDGG